MDTTSHNRVITTSSHGEVHFTRIAAHALTFNDQIIFGSNRVVTIRNNEWSARDPYAVTLSMRDAEDGLKLRLRFGINEPVRLVVGGRSGGMH